MSTTHASRSRLLIVIGWLLLLASCSAPSGHTLAHRTLPSQTVKPSFVYREQSSGLLSMAWSPDGKHIVSGGADLHVWDATSGKTLVTYTAHGTNDLIFAVAWSPDGKRIVSARIIPPAYGMLRQERRPSSIAAIRRPSRAWRGHPMASASHPPVKTGRCRSGMPQQAGPS